MLRPKRGSGFNADARKFGMRSNDIILEVDDRGRTTESEMLAYVLQHKHPGDEIKVRVLRDGERLELAYPVNGIVKQRGHDH